MDIIENIFLENEKKNKEPLYLEMRRRSHRMNISLKQAYNSIISEVKERYPTYDAYKNFNSCRTCMQRNGF